MLAALLALVFALPAPASAQTAPSGKPITIVVPFPPGPSLDLVARLTGARLAEALGQPVVVENRTGANGTLGSSAVARAAPDGQTLLFTTASTHVTAVHLMKSLSYDPVRDFTPIVAAVEPVTCLIVNSALPVNSVAELVAYAKARPGMLSYGSSGVGSVFHLVGELFNQTAGVSINHVPYRGVALERAGPRRQRGHQNPRGAAASALPASAGHPIDVGSRSGVSRALVLVRRVRAGRPAGPDGGKAQWRDQQGARCSRREGQA
jgi:tripartite-type tricarboxylate transporter receptor subunit TctC